MSIDNKIAVISVAVAGIALIISFWSVLVAKRALRLSERQYNDKLPDFELYFIEGFRFLIKTKSSMRRFLLFHLTVKNKAEFKNTLKAELEVEYLRDDDSFSKILLDHNPDLSSHIKESTLSIFPSDIEVDEKTIATKWLIFEQPSYISKSYRIEKYCMRLRDLHGNLQLSEAVLIKDVEE